MLESSGGFFSAVSGSDAQDCAEPGLEYLLVVWMFIVSWLLCV